jgi:hypothetical protein
MKKDLSQVSSVDRVRRHRWLAQYVLKRNDRMGCITNIIAGILGALVGGRVFSLIGGRGGLVDPPACWLHLLARRAGRGKSAL